ncbi:MAG TPA: group 1 truncated hemoglobin [Gemmatimonadaceae bacterium]|nr:group 1 truncated hemoglobin [Gemmatimonadaceae bacterium]
MHCLTRVIRGLMLASALPLLVACGGGEKDKAAAPDTPAAAPAASTLYDRLGGRDAIVAVVDSFVARVAADSRINGFFKATASDPTRLAAFKGKLVDQICQATGGPCTYTGKDMKTAHAGMKITSAHFDALVEDLAATLKAFNVAQADQDALLGALAPMKVDIVTK